MDRREVLVLVDVGSIPTAPTKQRIIMETAAALRKTIKELEQVILTLSTLVEQIERENQPVEPSTVVAPKNYNVI